MGFRRSAPSAALRRGCGGRSAPRPPPPLGHAVAALSTRGPAINNPPLPAAPLRRIPQCNANAMLLAARLHKQRTFPALRAAHPWWLAPRGRERGGGGDPGSIPGVVPRPSPSSEPRGERENLRLRLWNRFHRRQTRSAQPGRAKLPGRCSHGPAAGRGAAAGSARADKENQSHIPRSRNNLRRHCADWCDFSFLPPTPLEIITNKLHLQFSCRKWTLS